jgi:hypothetical protein
MIGQAEEGGDALVAEAVGDVAALLLPDYESTAMQTGEVVGDVGLGETGREHELAHGHRTLTQSLENAQAGGIRQASEELRFEWQVESRGRLQHGISSMPVIISVFDDMLLELI